MKVVQSWRRLWWLPLALLLVVGGWTLLHAFQRVEPGPAPEFAEGMAPSEREPVVVEPSWSAALQEAVSWGWVRAEFSGNGRDELNVSLAALTDDPIEVLFEEGLLFETPLGNNQVVVVRRENVLLAPGESATVELVTAATTCANRLERESYVLTSSRIKELQPLLRAIQRRPDLPVEALQTAVLAVTENPPLSVFAEFELVSGDLPLRHRTDHLRVPVREIIRALELLEEAGIGADQLALAIDPQLKVEAMIDPMTYAYALRYFDIGPEEEWAYWQTELLSGDLRTRHYALYGIGRYFPAVAVEMLPRWALNEELDMLYRASAVYALAETGRGEALTQLRRLRFELDADDELSNAVDLAKRHLSRVLRGEPVRSLPVEFQLTESLLREEGVLP